jgi:hypothetical protein
MKPRVLNEYLETALYSLPVGITIGFLYNRMTMVDFLVSLATGLLATAAGFNLLVANLVASLTLILMVNYYVREGFSTHTSQPDISSMIRKLKTENSSDEGFIGSVNQNITKGGYTNPGFGLSGPLVEGFEDEKKETKLKKSKPAPLEKVQELAAPFKLGEIPAQVKNGPHIDAGSTLMKAIQGLDPDQINAMTKDTQQLIETQKSLMGMLGSMKPMMNDGKELMETFQQMFGNN